MKMKWHTVLVISVLTLIFTVSLTFVSVELPRLADSFLQKAVDLPDVATGLHGEGDYKTELFLQHYHIRWLGYVSLSLVFLLIVLGFVTRRSGWSTAGAVFLFLPVFGHFAMTMFFLGGLALTRIVWLPFLDISFDLMRLGDIVLLPYHLLTNLSDRLGLGLSGALPHLFIAAGLLIFTAGVLAWFLARVRGKKVVDFWLYRFSRHPQYLGWIIWSYGIMLLPGNTMKRSFVIANTLPWLLSTLIIIGVALMEEIKMKQYAGDEYRLFRRKTPFLLPLPRWVNRLVWSPLKLFGQKEQPDRKGQVVVLLLFYGSVSILASLFYSGLIQPLKTEAPSPRERIHLVRRIAGAKSRIDIRNGLRRLSAAGDPAVDDLIGLLTHENLFVRWYTAQTLSRFKAERAVTPLIKRLHDRERMVRHAAAGSLGRMGYSRAVPPLIEVLQDPDSGITITACRALGQMGDARAVPPLVRILKKSPQFLAGQAALALGQIGDTRALQPLLHRLERAEDCPFYEVGMALQRFSSSRAEDAFIAGLEDQKWYRRISSIKALTGVKSDRSLEAISAALADENQKVRRAVVWSLMEIGSEKTIPTLVRALGDGDFEVRLYAREALRKLGHASH
jgi:HEAT repeat protein/protein-S-isoprenylcysteine O-methyltransferase Ste14